MKKLLVVLIICTTAWVYPTGPEQCTIKNRAFQDGENISYTVYYSVIGLFVNAGSASFTVDQTNFNNKTAYHVVGLGSSNPSYDWIFKVRDRYESYIDTGSLQPYKFYRNVDEGGYKIVETINFNQQNNTATTPKSTLKIPDCTQDVLSSIYYARNIDFSKTKPGDKIPFTMVLDNEVHNLYIKYEGREVIKTKYGRFNAIKFKPLLIKGTIFEGGAKMTVWVTDDANKIPIRIESPIVVGSVKVDMMGYKGLRYPMTALISKR